MSEFQQAMLLHIRCQLEQLITEREEMIATNQQCISKGAAPIYTRQEFHDLGNRIAALTPDPHQFS